MVTVEKGDLFLTPAKIICHQVNCRGAMNSGVALQVKEKYPHAFERYAEFCKSNENLLGKVLAVSVDPNFNGECGYNDNSQTICNLFAQENFGYDGGVYTSYDALKECLMFVRDMTKDHFNAVVAMPYLMGCHRGGGDWNTVYNMIEEIFKDGNVILYKIGD